MAKGLLGIDSAPGAQYPLAEALSEVSGKSKVGPRLRTATHTKQTRVRSKKALGTTLAASGDEGKAMRTMGSTAARAVKRGAF
tara:strand:+ start:886 stop:1134 length:249 start_codon:yes stop_codon:yes gene_type:complete